MRLAAILVFTAVACARPATAESIAEKFIDRYYIERDHAGALALSTGIAASRVAEEKKLVEEGQAAGAGASAVQPRIFYKLKKSVPEKDGVQLSYEMTIDSGGVSLKKELRVVVTQGKVSFFNETDLQ